FSSRRRHTRFSRDWSSDVCSSDLATLTGAPKVVFIFPGQGAQWLGMGRELFQHNSIFRESITACDAAFQPYTDWSLLDELNASRSEEHTSELQSREKLVCRLPLE